jgi:PBP1b-binding outer membrane lipoprotein LpoB
MKLTRKSVAIAATAAALVLSACATATPYQPVTASPSPATP